MPEENAQEISKQKTMPQKSSATIQDKNLIDSVLYLKQSNLLPENKSTIKFETTKEAEDEKKEEIVGVIKEKTNSYKSEISELQKAGYNLHFETIKLLEVSLKINVWKATLAKKDLETIFKLFQEIESVIKQLKQENEEKIKEKERLEKEKEEKEKLELQTKQKVASPKENVPTKQIAPKNQPTQSPKPLLKKPQTTQKPSQ